MEEIAARFGKNLLRARRRSGLSQEQVAQRASLHRTAIGMLEHGDRVPRIDTLVKLMTAVEASAADLLDGIAWVSAHSRDGAFVIASNRGPSFRRGSVSARATRSADSGSEAHW